MIGATGSRTGGHADELLLQRRHGVRVIVRGVDRCAERLAALGVDIVEGDVLDLDCLAQATKGIDARYLTCLTRADLMDATTNVAQAAEGNGVQVIVNMPHTQRR
ncbi:NAD(P)H-binding protein [Streptomyces sp. NPDC004393]